MRLTLVERVATEWENVREYRPEPRLSYYGDKYVVSFWTNGIRIYSYDTCIAERLPKGIVLLNDTSYSIATTKQRQKLWSWLRRNDYSIVPVSNIPRGAEDLLSYLLASGADTGIAREGN